MHTIGTLVHAEASTFQVDGILETALYGSDPEALREFYTRVLGLKLIKPLSDKGFALSAGRSVLLLFEPRRTRSQRGEVPPHGSTGSGHVAFTIPTEDRELWRQHLIDSGVSIESEVDWPRGGHSIYFRDPAGNSVELTAADQWTE